MLTAYLLQKTSDALFRVTMYEANERLGGKVQTCRFQSAAATYEAGAAELYDYSPVDDDPLRDLIAELGLSTQPMGGSAVIIDGQIVSNLEGVHSRWGLPAGRALSEFDRDARDSMSPREFFHSDQLDTPLADSPPPAPAGVRFDSVTRQIGDPNVRRLVEVQIHSDLATEPAQTSVSYGLQNYLMNDPAYMRLYCIEGGNGLFPQELARRIAADIRLEHRVTGVCTGEHGRLRVHSDCRGEAREDEFDFVVVALPHNALSAVRFGPARLADAMARHHQHYDHPAHYLRITLLFAEPFWRRSVADSYFMVDCFEGCCLYDESAREPGVGWGVLGWLLAGQAALKLSQRSDDQLIELALNSLPAVLGEGRSLFREGKVHRWIGAVNAIPGGTRLLPLDQRHQPEPVEHPNLFVVGDYLFDSTLNGVLDSADYVAHWLAALMADNTTVTS